MCECRWIVCLYIVVYVMYCTSTAAIGSWSMPSLSRSPRLLPFTTPFPCCSLRTASSVVVSLVELVVEWFAAGLFGLVVLLLWLLA